MKCPVISCLPFNSCHIHLQSLAGSDPPLEHLLDQRLSSSYIQKLRPTKQDPVRLNVKEPEQLAVYIASFDLAPPPRMFD